MRVRMKRREEALTCMYIYISETPRTQRSPMSEIGIVYGVEQDKKQVHVGSTPFILWTQMSHVNALYSSTILIPIMTMV